MMLQCVGCRRSLEVFDSGCFLDICASAKSSLLSQSMGSQHGSALVGGGGVPSQARGGESRAGGGKSPSLEPDPPGSHPSSATAC